MAEDGANEVLLRPNGVEPWNLEHDHRFPSPQAWEIHNTLWWNLDYVADRFNFVCVEDPAEAADGKTKMRRKDTKYQWLQRFKEFVKQSKYTEFSGLCYQTNSKTLPRNALQANVATTGAICCYLFQCCDHLRTEELVTQSFEILSGMLSGVLEHLGQMGQETQLTHGHGIVPPLPARLSASGHLKTFHVALRSACQTEQAYKVWIHHWNEMHVSGLLTTDLQTDQVDYDVPLRDLLTFLAKIHRIRKDSKMKPSDNLCQVVSYFRFAFAELCSSDLQQYFHCQYMPRHDVAKSAPLRKFQSERRGLYNKAEPQAMWNIMMSSAQSTASPAQLVQSQTNLGPDGSSALRGALIAFVLHSKLLCIVVCI
jgi:hypothetical protein